MGCYNCQYLKEDDKKDGKINGFAYYCTKYKKYIRGSDDACDNYKYDNLRRTYIKDEIYRDGLRYQNDGTPFGTYLLIAIILFIIAIIVNI